MGEKGAEGGGGKGERGGEGSRKREWGRGRLTQKQPTREPASSSPQTPDSPQAAPTS